MFFFSVVISVMFVWGATSTEDEWIQSGALLLCLYAPYICAKAGGVSAYHVSPTNVFWVPIAGGLRMASPVSITLCQNPAFPSLPQRFRNSVFDIAVCRRRQTTARKFPLPTASPQGLPGGGSTMPVPNHEAAQLRPRGHTPDSRLVPERSSLYSEITMFRRL